MANEHVVFTHVSGFGVTTYLKRPNAVFKGMARHPKLCVAIIIAVIVLILEYGNSLQTKPLVIPAKEPSYFFSSMNSDVLDSPRGSLINVVELLHRTELVFVMYYATWCSKSQAAKLEFEKAARLFKGKVYFAAVNCWWPEGDCKKRYKFLMFPVFMAYHTKLDGYRYSGLPRAEYMVRFIEDLINPITFVNSRKDALLLLSRSEQLVLGFFNLSSAEQDHSYRQFYYAAMRITEKSQHRVSKFAVVSKHNVAKEFLMESYEQILLLRLTNSSLFYPYTNNITSSNIVRWVLNSTNQKTVGRLYLEGIKSKDLSTEINKGPAFILFHPENPLFSLEYGLCVVRYTALQYHKCRIGDEFLNVGEAWLESVEKDVKKYQESSSLCVRWWKSKFSSPRLPCCFSALQTVMGDLQNGTRICNVCHEYSHESYGCVLERNLFSEELKTSVSNQLVCSSKTLSYRPKDRVTVCCRKTKAPDNSTAFFDDLTYYSSLDVDMPFRTTDRYVRSHLENIPRRLCDRLSLETKQGLRRSWSAPRTFRPSSISRETPPVTVSSCAHNNSLNFYAIDSHNQWMFSDALGLNLTELPTAVIFNKQKEEQYHLKETLTYSNTMSFIAAFHSGDLSRHQQSHSFDPSPSCNQGGQLCVTELNSGNFVDFVNTENKDVVVLIYSHWCGFCQTLSHTFLELAHYFQNSPHIRFARINSETNDLPWKYTLDVYPTVLVFPAHGKSESVVFPDNKEKSLRGLVQFVIRHTSQDTSLHVTADYCTSKCIQENIIKFEKLLSKLETSVKTLEADNSANGRGSKSYESLAGSGTNTASEAQLKLKRLKNSIKNIKSLYSYLLANQDQGLSKTELNHRLSRINLSVKG